MDAATTTMHDTPTIGVVVPLFKHSGLIGDALACLVAQTIEEDFVVVVVNDGCPFRESVDHVNALRVAGGARIRSVFQPNGGLSAARNAGVDFLLREYPGIQAIYFMDADNRLRPDGLAAAYARLMASRDAGWVYPNIDMFGIGRHYEYSGPYSPFKHAFYNICEAGSLVSRRVFDAGIRFDPLMRKGYEDWEFWLACAAAGFNGVHEPHFGFLYRNRAESMLSQSKRDEAGILAYVRAKHPRLWHPARLQAWEDEAAPRHAVILLDTDDVLLGLSAQSPLSHSAFQRLLWRNIAVPDMQHVPQFLIFTTRAAYDELATAGLLGWAIHDTQAALHANDGATHDVATLELRAAAGRAFTVGEASQSRPADWLGLTRDILTSILKDQGTDWIEQLLQPGADFKCARRLLTLPRAPSAPGGGAAVFGFLYLVARWRASPFRASAGQAWHWRERSVPAPHLLYLDSERRLGTLCAYPRPRDRRLSIGFALPVGRFGGVERVAFNCAAVFNQAGWSTHLFMIGTAEVTLPEEFARAFTSINFVGGDGLRGWDEARQYQGTSLPACAGDAAAMARMVGALGWLDVVVNHHCGPVGEAAALLRRGGTLIVAHLHLMDRSPVGRPTGHPMLALAYEHAYDHIVCGSARLLAWMRAAGVPADKLMLLPNAPSYAPPAADRSAILAARLAATHRSLRVLYLGRLDRQKGIFRLAGVVAATQAMDIAWRIVGSTVIDEAEILPPALAGLIEPPVTSSADLTRLYAWADVLVLLSDFEGVPLSILEAQNLGACVIATDVGGVGEVIENGGNGFLVTVDNAVAETTALLRMLTDCPAVRHAIARACHVPNWADTCAPLVRQLEAAKEGFLF